MPNTEIKFDNIIDLMIKNDGLIKVMQGYCTSLLGEVNEINALSSVLNILLSNHEKIWDDISEVQDDVFKLVHPEFFKQ